MPVVYGTVTNHLGMPCQRKVFLMTRPTSESDIPVVISHGISDPVTGRYSLETPNNDEVSRIVIAEGDNPFWTESLWNTRRLRAVWQLMRTKGPFSPQWITITNDCKWEGLGVIIELTSKDVSWWPDSCYAVIKFAEYKNGMFCN